MKNRPCFLLLFLIMNYSASYAQTAYGGKVRTIPGLIEAEDFDLGGEGLGYHDRQTKNPGRGYRPDEAPGIKGMTVPEGKADWYKSNESTPTIGWFFVGEWLNYTARAAPRRCEAGCLRYKHQSSHTHEQESLQHLH